MLIPPKPNPDKPEPKKVLSSKFLPKKHSVHWLGPNPDKPEPRKVLSSKFLPKKQRVDWLGPNPYKPEPKRVLSSKILHKKQRVDWLGPNAKSNWKHIFAKFLFVSIVTLLISGILVVISFAQEATPYSPSDDEVNSIAKQLYCPVCENIPLDVCPTQACAQWRALIHEKLSLGWDEEQIKSYFVNQYGDRVLDEPPLSGLNWLVYLVPPVVFFLGAYLLFRGLHSWKQSAENVEHAESDSSSPTPQSDDYISRIEDELQTSDW